MPTEKVTNLLANWGGHRGGLGTLSEIELKEALASEKRGKRRETVLVAVHRRYNRLRTERERKELKETAGAKRKRG